MSAWKILWQRRSALLIAAAVVCLDDEWRGTKHYYRYRCQHGREWQRRGDNLQDRPSCPACKLIHNYEKRPNADVLKASLAVVLGRPKHENLAVFRELARARGGSCLSKHFVNSHAKLRWLCHQGHECSASYAPVRKGSWCPQCANLAMISDRHSTARKKYDDAGRRLLDGS